MASRLALSSLSLLLSLACNGGSGDGTDAGTGTTAPALTTGSPTSDPTPTGSATDTGTPPATSVSGDSESASQVDTDTDTPPAPTTDNTTSVSGSSSTGDVCADADVSFEPKIPTIYLLIDQSGSMTANFGGVSRWQAVYDALLAPGEGLVEQFQDDVRFGMGLYTAADANPTCPNIVEVAPEISNYTAMEALFQMNFPIEDTPTGDSIDAILPTVMADPGDGAKVIVLATDGEPDTCAVLDPQNGQPEAIAAAAAAYAQGIRVYYISVGDEVTDAHAQDMANAGAGVQMGDPDAPFYKANDQDALIDAFNQIIEGVRDCKFELNGSVADGMAGQCSVVINGMPVDLDDPNGWQLNDPSEIELVGDACDAIQTGEVEIKISCTCGAIIPG
jgi:hypothetical protein